MTGGFYYHALITLPSSVYSYSKRLFVASPRVFTAVNDEVCMHNVMIHGEMFILIRSVGDAISLSHLDSSIECLFIQRCASVTGVERGGRRKGKSQGNSSSWEGGRVLSMITYAERLRPKGVSFSGFRFMKG